MKAKKKCDINKMTRKQLVVKCRGRGITIGKLEAKIDKLEVKLAIGPDVAELYDSYMESLKTIDILKEHVVHRDQLIEGLTEDITNADALLAQGKRLSEDADNIIDNLRRETVDRNARISDLKEAWTNACHTSKKHDEHWRELAEFTALNTGQLINALKTMHTASAYINDKYKEE